MDTSVNNSDITGAGWPCWLATMKARSSAVKAGSLWDDAALTRLPKNAARPVTTGWRAGCVCLAGWLLAGLNR